MDVLCTADMCPVILNATCVFYEGNTLLYTGITTNDSLQTALQKIDAKFGDAMVGYTFTNGVYQSAAGAPVGLGGNLTADTSIGGNYTLTFTGNLRAAKHITTGGTSSDFVKGDGTLDSTAYQAAGNYITALTGDVIATGPGSVNASLAVVNSNPGTYGSGTRIPVVTVDTKGRVTALTTTAIVVPSGSLSFVGDVYGSGTTGSTTTLTLSNVNTNIYTVNSFLKFKVNAKGLVTGAAPITHVDIEGVLGYVPVPETRTLSINGVTHDLQSNISWTIATGVSGVTASAPLSATGGPVPNISIPKATATTDGYLDNVDWDTFNNKQSLLNGSGLVRMSGLTLTYDNTAYTPQSRVLTINGVSYDLSANRSWTITSMIYPSAGIAVSTGTAWGTSIVDNSTDWNTAYANRISSLTTTGSSGPATLISNVLNIPNYTLSGLGGVPTTRTLTINGVDYDLSSDRSWTINPMVYPAAGIPVSTGTAWASSITDNSADWNTAYSERISSASAPLSIASNTISISQAGTSANGYLSSTDWNTFNSKEPAITAGTTSQYWRGDKSWQTLNTTAVTEGTNLYYTDGRVRLALSASAPLTYSSDSGTFGITKADASTNGYLSSTDWNTFNNKQPADHYITDLTGEATAAGPGIATVTLSTPAVTGKALTGINIAGGTVVATDTILEGFGKLQNQINSLIGGSIYKGTWNASTNTPTITSSVGTLGWYYIVDVAGTTNINGITDWQVGDWIIFNGTVWNKVDNTDAVISVNGYTGAVSLVSSDIPEGSTNLYFTNTRARQAISLTTTGSSGAATYNDGTGVLNIPNYNPDLSGYVPITRTLTINGTVYDLSANRSWSVGTVTSVAALTLGTTGTDLSSSVATGTSTPVITLNVPTASATNRGALSSTDWSTFNSKQAALSGTGFVKISGTTISYDNSTYLSTSSAASTYLPLVGGTLTGGLVINPANTGTVGLDVASNTVTLRSDSTNPFPRQLTTTMGSGTLVKMQAAGYGAAYVTDLGFYTSTGSAVNATPNLYLTGGNNRVGINTDTPSYTLDVVGTAGVSGQLTLGSTITNGTYTYTLPSATGTLALASSLSSYVPTSRTLTINGTAYDLSADRTWTIASYSLPVATASVLGGVKIGAGVSVDAAGIISVSTNYQAPLGGTGFVKSTAGTISYDTSTYLTTASAASTYLPLAGGTLSGILYSTYNTATGIANNAFNNAKTIIGNIHIQNGGGTSGNNYQAAITFQGGTASEAQAGIYVSNNGSTGTAMGFATTDSYATGPQLFMTATNTGQVNFPRARPTYAGNTILDAGNYNSYSPTLTGGGASGTWGISISGNAATATSASSATSATTAATATNSTQLNGISSTQIFNNMGNNHTTYSDFNSVGNFGVRYVQGGTNAPQSGQFYGFTLGLGNDYSINQYGSQFYWMRNTATPYVWIRYLEGGSWGSWNKISAGYADTAANSDSLGSYAASTYLGKFGNGNGYYQANNWIQMNANAGLFWPSYYGLHLYPNNDGSYGSLQVNGAKNSWSGIYFSDSSNHLMMNSNESGHYRQGYGWQFRWYNGGMYVSTNATGGGSEGTVWHSINAPRAANSNLMYYSGFTLDANSMPDNSNGFTYSQNAPYTGPIMKFGDGGYAMQINGTYSGGTSIAYRTRNGDAGSWNGWYAFITSANIGSQSVSSATTATNLSGFDKTNPSFGAVYANNWFRAQGDCGLYSQDYGGHLRRSLSTSFGNWETFGYNRNGWGGFGYINNYTLNMMMDASGNHGFYQENGRAWTLFFNYGNNCWGIGTDNTYSGDGFRCIKYGSAEYGWTTWSDRRAKENISTITGALNKVLAMRGVYYNYIKDEAKVQRVGFIAQELMEVLPQAVRYAEEIDEYNVNYDQIVSVLAEGMKEQHAIILEQGSQINELKLLVEQLINK